MHVLQLATHTTQTDNWSHDRPSAKGAAKGARESSILLLAACSQSHCCTWVLCCGHQGGGRPALHGYSQPPTRPLHDADSTPPLCPPPLCPPEHSPLSRRSQLRRRVPVPITLRTDYDPAQVLIKATAGQIGLAHCTQSAKSLDFSQHHA